MKEKIKIGFSPCPNDTFMFYPMLHGKIDTGNMVFEPVIADVEELNRKAFNEELEVTKLSYFAFAQLTDKYELLHAGSALGRGCGPLLISKKPIEDFKERAGEMKVAIPGKNTTANLLFSVAYPETKDKVEVLFSEIEDKVLNGEVDAGVIIHENRFTYKSRGLHKIADLGAFWEEKYGVPIPLGGIAVKRNLPLEIKQKINSFLAQSVENAFHNPNSGLRFMKKHASEMEEKVMFDHVKLYVNDYSLDLGEEGRKAVLKLKEEAENLGFIEKVKQNLFLKETVKKL